MKLFGLCDETSDLSSYPESSHCACSHTGVGWPHQCASLDSFLQGSADKVLQPQHIHRGVFLFNVVLYRLG